MQNVHQQVDLHIVSKYLQNNENESLVVKTTNSLILTLQKFIYICPNLNE